MEKYPKSSISVAGAAVAVLAGLLTTLYPSDSGLVPKRFNHTYIHTHIHTHIHTYIHTYTHTHIHTYRQTDRQTNKHTYININNHRSSGFRSNHLLRQCCFETALSQ